MLLLITKENCMNCYKAKMLLINEPFIEIDKAFVSSSILELANDEYPIVFNLLGNYDDLEKHINNRN